MRPGPVEHHQDLVAGECATEFIEEHAEAVPVEVRHVQVEALARGRLDGRVEPQPFVPVLVGPRRANAGRAPPSSEPRLETEPRLVHGEHPPGGVLGEEGTGGVTELFF
jgi:hypothetical protein